MLDAPPSRSQLAKQWALLLAFCALLMYGLYRFNGLLGVLAAAVICGGVLSRPLIDLVERVSQRIRYEALLEKRGFRTAFKGTSLHIDEWLDLDDDVDGKEHICVNLRDLLTASLSQDKAGLTTRLADITVQIEKLPYVRLEPLVKRLSGNVESWDGSIVINDHLQRLGRYLGHQILLPWQRKKGRKPSVEAFGSAETAEFAKPHVVPTVALPPK
jgi:hypothetical protein